MPFDLSHLLDLIIGASIGAAPAIIEHDVTRWRTRRAVRAQIDFLLEDLDAHIDGNPTALANALEALRARTLDHDAAGALAGRLPPVFDALRAAAAITDLPTRSPNLPNARSAARTAIAAARRVLGSTNAKRYAPRLTPCRNC